MRRCSDDMLDALSYSWKRLSTIDVWNDMNLIINDIPVIGIPMEAKMRFEVVKVNGEVLDKIYGDVYTIADNMDDDSPVSTFRMLKPNAEKVCRWLNENIKKYEVSPEKKIDKLVKELWGDDEVRVEHYQGRFFLIEEEDTYVTVQHIANKLGIKEFKIGYDSLSPRKSIYKIMESDLKDE